MNIPVVRLILDLKISLFTSAGGGVQFSSYGMLNILNKPFSYVLSRHSLEGDCRKDYTIRYIQCFEGGAAINLHKTLMQACVVANANS